MVFLCLQNDMVMQDKHEKERADSKNAVEEYVYEMRDKLFAVYENYITEDVSNLTFLEIFPLYLLEHNVKIR